MNRDIYVSLPAMFTDTNGIDGKNLALCLRNSLYGLKEAPKLWPISSSMDLIEQVSNHQMVTLEFIMVVSWL